ncbi:hypothetical protein EVAR_10159_1 [Eumeta japonica]|uniref:Uncharacterized protein n=1 Tax=Eumeta variegata TaxID=151549 RepID=A0A4C1UCF6_EUMVA|nr:hypothetical protein EVAR_10159_1 [Eumeta japonica]
MDDKGQSESRFLAVARIKNDYSAVAERNFYRLGLYFELVSDNKFNLHKKAMRTLITQLFWNVSSGVHPFERQVPVLARRAYSENSGTEAEAD